MKKKISNFFSQLFYGLGFGMRNAEDEMLFSKHSSDSDSSYIEQINERNVGKDLLKGEVTQEVEDLRYSTYKVYRESNNYEYMGNGVSVKKEKNVFNINNFKFVQKNKIFCKSIYESFDESKDDDVDKFTLTFGYITSPKFRLERFVESIEVNSINGVVNITLRFPKAFDNFSPITKMFYNELMKLETSERGNEIYSDNISSLCFTTYKAQGEDDFIMYAFSNLKPKKYEFFNDYVNIVFTTMVFNREDLTAKFFSSHQQDKYEVREKKNNKITMFSTSSNYKCSECGNDMNQFDYDITLYDFGRALCIKCLEKYLTLKE